MVQLYGSFLRGAGGTIRDVSRSLLRGETSVSQLCADSLRLIEQSKKLNPFITICGESALKRAQELDKLLETSDRDAILAKNPLFGVPISIKDNFCTKSLLTTCCSKMLYNFVPPYTATAVSKLEATDCLIMGKTNMDEFAMGSSCMTSHYGPAANCWNANQLDGPTPQQCHPSKWFMAGGSSTGSAVSVACGACFASLGTDTGGSTRQPASLTGIVGFKPTYGLISRFGVVPLAHCLDVVSILTRCVDDAGLMFDALVGMDENDLTSVDHRKELKGATANRKVITVGVPEEFIAKCNLSDGVEESFQESLRLLLQTDTTTSEDDSVKFKVKKLSLPNANLATECYTIISSTEIASNMSCYDGVKYGFATKLDDLKLFDRDQFYRANRDGGFGSEVKKRILLGNYFLLEGNRDKYLVQALKLRRLIADEFQRAFAEDGIDIMVMPSTPTTSVSHEQWLKKQDDNELFREDYFLIPANLANLPSISLPATLTANNLPTGLQVIANKFHDLDLLNSSKLIEKILMQRFR